MTAKPTRERVKERPDPTQWGMDELMTLREAVELHWPRGPITVATLRTAIRDGQLPVCNVARKFFLTRRCLLELVKGSKFAGARASGGESSRSGGRMSREEAKSWLASVAPCSPRDSTKSVREGK